MVINQQKRIQILLLIDTILLSILAVFTEIIGEILKVDFFYVSFSFLLVLIALFRWHYKSIIILLFFAIARTYYLCQDVDLHLWQAIVLAVVIATAPLIIVPLIKRVDNWSKTISIIVIGTLTYFIMMISISVVIAVSLEKNIIKTFAALIYDYNFSLVICLLIAAIFLAQRELLVFVPSYLEKEMKHDDSTK